MSEKHVPLRMCIACREKKPKRELIRIVKGETGVHLDFSGRAAGRGAYLCNREECVRRLVRFKLANKAFSSEVSQEVYERLGEEFLEGNKN